LPILPALLVGIGKKSSFLHRAIRLATLMLGKCQFAMPRTHLTESLSIVRNGDRHRTRASGLILLAEIGLGEMAVHQRGFITPSWNPRLGTLISRNRLALRRLTRQQKSLDQSTLAANCHAGESLVPLTHRYFGLAVEPLRQQFQLRCGDLPAPDAVEQMLQQGGRYILAADSGHGLIPWIPVLDPIEAARETFFDTRRLNRIRSRRKPLSQQA